MTELSKQDFLPNPDPIGFYFLGSDRLPYNGSEDLEAPRTYLLNEKLKFRLALPVQNVVGKSLSLIIKVGGVPKSLPYSKDSSTGEYIEFNYIVSGSDAGSMIVESVESNGSWTLPLDGLEGLVGPVAGGDGLLNDFSKFSGHWPGRADFYDVKLSPDVMINGADESGSVRASTLLLKRSSVPGKEPLGSDLFSGELAINTNDGKLFAKLADGNVRHLNSIEPQVFSVEKITLSSSQNDLDVGGKAVARVDATLPDLSVSGISAGSDGQILMIYNGGAEPFSLLNNSELSADGNRMITFSGEDFVLEPNGGTTILYDSTSGAWRLF